MSVPYVRVERAFLFEGLRAMWTLDSPMLVDHVLRPQRVFGKAFPANKARVVAAVTLFLMPFAASFGEVAFVALGIGCQRVSFRCT